eukprot:g7394.t1
MVHEVDSAAEMANTAATAEGEARAGAQLPSLRGARVAPAAGASPAPAGGGEYDGWFPTSVAWRGSVDATTVEMCRLNTALHHRDPSSVPMFRDLVAHSNCGGANARSATVGQLRADIAAHPGSVIAPSGFVFHEARVGSTLVANMLTSSTRNLVYTESKPPATVLAHCDKCSDEQQVELLRVVMGQMGRGRATGHDRLFFKFQSAMVAFLPAALRAFPATPWIFLHRNPVEIQASMFKHGAGGNPPCTRGQYDPPAPLLRLVGKSPAEARSLPKEQYCAAHLAMMCQHALDAAAKFGAARARFVEYAGLVDTVLADVFPRHFAWAMSAAELARAKQVSTLYSKARNNQRAFKDDSAKKQQRASDVAKRWSREYVEPLYHKMQSLSKSTSKASPGGGPS